MQVGGSRVSTYCSLSVSMFNRSMTTSVEQTTVERRLPQGTLAVGVCRAGLSAECVMEQSIQTSMCYASLLFVKFNI